MILRYVLTLPDLVYMGNVEGKTWGELQRDAKLYTKYNKLKIKSWKTIKEAREEIEKLFPEIQEAQDVIQVRIVILSKKRKVTMADVVRNQAITWDSDNV